MTHDEARPAVEDMPHAPFAPRVESSTLPRFDFGSGRRPPANQLILKPSFVGTDDPVAAVANDVIADLPKSIGNAVASVRAECRAKALVCPLMPIYQISNEL